eukprot:TRINITY_DN9185_c0_g5_i1.p1 TRINITY_DN9185_c0_g5~~TRINITY_DN9185_c0_g5_i1.p1  ORF type:complete len:463 (-),score=178.03 TRINITY_DN9185_c0_g5_i1:60-1448(-)
MAILALRRGDCIRSINYAKMARDNLLEKKSHVCNCLLGTIYAHIGETKKASEIFRFVAESTGNHDVYAVIGEASVALVRAQRGEKVNEEMVKKTLNGLVLALEMDERNAYATIGVGNCLVLLGKHDEAVQIYKLVNETFSNTQMAMVNLARVYMLNGRRADAIPIYRKYIEKYGKKEEMVELELAAAYCQDGMHDEALVVLKTLQIRFPSNPIVKYNTAVCLKEQVKALFRTRIRKASQTQDAIRRIKVAVSLLEQVRETKLPLTFTGLPAQSELRHETARMIEVVIKKSDDQLLYCKDILSSSEEYLEKDLRVEEDYNQQRKEQERIMREQMLAAQAVVSRRTVTQEEEDEMRRRLTELTENLKTEVAERNAKKKDKRGKKAKEKEKEEERREDEIDEEINKIDDEEEKEFNFEEEMMDVNPEENAYSPTEMRAPAGQEVKVAKKRRLHKMEEDEPNNEEG